MIGLNGIRRGKKMARVNIEECWWNDPRRQAFIIAVGDTFKADGIVFSLWKLGQDFETNGQPVPISIFEAFPFWEKAVECGLAEKNCKGYYIKGTKDSSNYRRTATERQSNAGKRSAEARKLKYGTSIPINATNYIEPNQDRTEPNRPNPSSSSSSSKKNKELNTINQTRKVSKMPNAPEPDGSGPVISAYCSAFKKRYNTNPTITPKDISQVKQIIKAVGYEKALVMVQVYVQMENPWFKKKTHDLQTLLGNIQAVSVASKTGIDPDKKEDRYSFLKKESDLCL